MKSTPATSENENAPLRLWLEAALVSGEWAENVRLSIADGIITGIEQNVSRQPGDETGSVGIPRAG